MSQVIDSLPIRDITLSQLQELTKDYLEDLSEILQVTRNDAREEEVPIAVVIPYYIFAKMKKSLEDAETLSKLVVQSAANQQAKSKLIT